MIEKQYLKFDIVFALLLIILVSVFIKKITYKQKINTYRIYYDDINQKILNEMANYNINIVESLFFNKENVNYLHNNNSKVIGYISLIEIGPWDNDIIDQLDEEDYLKDKNNNKLKSLDNSNFLGDLSSKHFRDVLINVINKRIIDKEMDGIFFDTLDWIDYYKDNNYLYEKLITGYEQLLKEIKLKNPNIILFQNRGFESYFSFSKKYISSILWENFISPYINNKKSKIYTYKKLKRYAKIYKTDVYIISFTNDYINRIIAKKNNWNYLYSQMDDRYSKWDIKVK